MSVLEGTMNYWRISATRQRTYAISAKDEEFDKLIHYLFGGESVIDRWDSSVELYFKKGSVKDSDVFLYDEDYFIINSKVRKIFDAKLHGELEYLDFKCDEKDLIIAYPIKTVDCIDMERSEYRVYKADKDRIQRADKLYLNKEKIGESNLFRMKHIEYGYLVCSDTLKNELEKRKVKGIEFALID